MRHPYKILDEISAEETPLWRRRGHLGHDFKMDLNEQDIMMMWLKFRRLNF
jgi:hypothetical protein